MKLCVTGCNGYIGGHLVEALLADGHSVVGVDHRAPTWQQFEAQGDYHFEQFELSERAAVARLTAALAGVDAIFHLASHQPFSWDPAPFVYGNVDRALTMLEAARAAGTKRIVLSSTYAVYGEAVQVPITEADPLLPKNIYEVTKYQAEMLADVYSRLSDVQVAALRYTSVYGGRNRVGSLYYFLESAVMGRPIKLFAQGKTVRDYVHVDDVVAANMNALKTQHAAGFDVFNVGGGDPLSTADLVKLVCEVTGHSTTVEHVDDPNWKAVDLYVDITKASGVLAYKPRTMREGLTRFWQEIAPTLEARSA